MQAPLAALIRASSAELGEAVPTPRRSLVLSQNSFVLSCEMTPPEPANRIEPAVNADRVRFPDWSRLIFVLVLRLASVLTTPMANLSLLLSLSSTKMAASRSTADE